VIAQKISIQMLRPYYPMGNRNLCRVYSRPGDPCRTPQTLLLGRNAPLTVLGFSLDANGAFRPEQSTLPHRTAGLRPGTHPTHNQAFGASTV